MSKSLEIVNKNIKAIKKLLYNLKDIQEGTREDFDKYYHEQELKEQQQIKQDLEVLEILRKNLYFWYGNAGKPITEIHTFLNDYNNPIEFNKVKQWLEENENDR